MSITSFKVDKFSIQLFSVDNKGVRTRWGDRIIHVYSGRKKVAQAVFGQDGEKVPEPYFKDGMIYYFAYYDQYESVKSLLEGKKTVFVAWKPVHDKKEKPDGDAYFYTEKD